MKQWLASVLLALFVVTAAGAASTAPPSPAVMRALADPSRPPEDRDADLRRAAAELLAFAEIRSGQRVVDLLPGYGYFTRLLSALVGPQGRVYAVVPPRRLPSEPDPAEDVQAIASSARDGNVTVRVQRITELDLPEPVGRGLDVARLPRVPPPAPQRRRRDQQARLRGVEARRYADRHRSRRAAGVGYARRLDTSSHRRTDGARGARRGGVRVRQRQQGACEPQRHARTAGIRRPHPRAYGPVRAEVPAADDAVSLAEAGVGRPKGPADPGSCYPASHVVEAIAPRQTTSPMARPPTSPCRSSRRGSRDGSAGRGGVRFGIAGCSFISAPAELGWIANPVCLHYMRIIREWELFLSERWRGRVAARRLRAAQVVPRPAPVERQLDAFGRLERDAEVERTRFLASPGERDAA